MECTFRQEIPKIFQFLMVRLKENIKHICLPAIERFQFLMVRLKAKGRHMVIVKKTEFQFLMVRLKVELL